jgi:hypothetical protein
MEFKRGDLVLHVRNPEFRTGIVLDVREDRSIEPAFRIPQIQVRFSVGGLGWFPPRWLHRLTVDTARSPP